MSNTPIWPWSAWQCEVHKVWFGADASWGDFVKCIQEDCKVLAYHESGTSANGVGVRLLMFDHENYPWIPDKKFLPEYM